MQRIEKVEVAGKKVFLRADLDVDLRAEAVADEFRLEAVLSTIDSLLERGARVGVAGHLGRPDGFDPLFSLAPVVSWFEVKLDRKIKLLSLGEDKGDDLFFFENLRFFPGEVVADESFARKLTAGFDLYVNEAFGNSHRLHASMVTVTHFLPAFAGIHLFREVEILGKIRRAPHRPLVVLLGGQKSETKVPVIPGLLSWADWVLVAGTLDRAKGLPKSGKLLLPKDSLDNRDIGPETVSLFTERLRSAATIIWSGPPGQFEEEKYSRGTKELVEIICQARAETIVGGGETVWALDRFGDRRQVSFVSSGGGAMLTFLSGGRLPALEALGYRADPIDDQD